MLEFYADTSWYKPPHDWQRAAFLAVQEHYGNITCDDGVISAVMGSGKSFLIARLCQTMKLAHNEIIIVSTTFQNLVEQIHDDIEPALRGATRTLGRFYSKRKRMGRVIVACNDSLVTLSKRLAPGTRVKCWIVDEAHKSENEQMQAADAALKAEHKIGFTATPYLSQKSKSLKMFDRVLYKYEAKQALKDGVIVPWRVIHHTAVKDHELDGVCLGFIQKTLAGKDRFPGIVNARSIEDADYFANYLRSNNVHARALHSQSSDPRGILDAWKFGSVQVVVHVNMLSEGANFPFIRFMVLRRAVTSRVRFAQEIGRALRCDVGKLEALIFDPLDLFGDFPITVEEALGERPLPPTCAALVRRVLENENLDLEESKSFFLSTAEQLARNLVIACDVAGWIDEKKRLILPRCERSGIGNPMQLAAIEGAYRLARVYIPLEYQEAITRIRESKISNLFRIGFLSDLACALQAIADNKAWPPLDTEGRISGDLKPRRQLTLDGVY